MSSSAPIGHLIAFDGIDGTGKTTHSKALAEELRERGHEVVISKEPTDGPWGKKLRESALTGRLSAEEELDLFIRDRKEHVEQLIAPALASGKYVILDRYYFSNIAYQGARGLELEKIRKANEVFAPLPSRLFILDLDVDQALERIGTRGDTANEFEQRENLERCREIFLALREEPFVRIIDTSGTKEEVDAMISAALP